MDLPARRAFEGHHGDVGMAPHRRANGGARSVYEVEDPDGAPASDMISASRLAASSVSFEGFSTMVQPAAKTGRATLAAATAASTSDASPIAGTATISSLAGSI